MNTKFEPIIGLEIHVELKTASKMFCGCRNDPFHAPKPNMYTCPICLGLPGALPVPNRKAVEWCVMLGQALNCEIPLQSKFDRKNYFYPDLPKGYQISQYDQPFCRNGWLEIPGEDPIVTKKIGITRVHMEEDTGKLIHAKVDGRDVSLVDFNRSSVPLVEIVTEPDIRSSEEARTFLKALHQIIRYIGISDADMEKGSMRLEPNISLRPKGSAGLPNYKVEVKNINSFTFAKKAIDFELDRHAKILENGETPAQETRGWDEKKNVTVAQRSKEEAHDYRYFPDPDIPPIRWTKEQIAEISTRLPELPAPRALRFRASYQLSLYDSTLLSDSIEIADYFEASIKEIGKQPVTAKDIANWIINKKADWERTEPKELVSLIVRKKQAASMPLEELEKIVETVIKTNEKPVIDYRSGKEQALMFLLGTVMREAKGKADASTVKTLLVKMLA